MTVRIVLIGASGHIGTAVLEALSSASLGDIDVHSLVRTEEDSRYIADNFTGFGSARIIDFSQDAQREDLISELSEAQIVINCAPDIGINSGLTTVLTTLSSPPPPPTTTHHPRHTFYIHTSGAARIWPSALPKTISSSPDGAASDKGGGDDDDDDRIWDDVADLSQLPAGSTATHAATDSQVQAANTASFHTAIVSPCFVIGRSKSRRHRSPIIFPDWMHVLRSVGGGWTVGDGSNVTTFVDTEELARLYVLLVEDALAVIRGGGDPHPRGGGATTTTTVVVEEEVRKEVWGPEGYFFAESVETSFREFTERQLVPALKANGATAGEWIRNEEGGIKELELGEVARIIMNRLGGEGSPGAGVWSQHLAEGFATSMRIRGRRAREYLGWESKGRVNLDEAVRSIVLEVEGGKATWA